MAIEAPSRGPRRAVIVALSLLATCGAAYADDPTASGVNDAQPDVTPGAAASASAPRMTKLLWLPQTRSDWDEIVAVARVNPARPENAAIDGLEEVLVTAPEDLLPMPGVYEQMWGGIVSPFWAVLHPTQAWRIFLPIPPQ